MRWILLLLASISCLTCGVKKQLTAAPEDLFIERLNQLVTCLNERNAPCLEDLYSPQFTSFSPLLDIDNVQDFVKTTCTNMAKNNFFAVANITELQVGISMAYVRLDWQLVSPNEKGTYDLMANETRLDIWRMEGKKWRLYRSLFYKEIAY